MLILLINTVLSPNGVSLFSSKGECFAEKTWKKAESHSEKLFPSLEAVLKKAKKTWRDLDAIAVVNGPGPFTSLRVGISLANAAGFALNIPVYSVPPLSLRGVNELPASERRSNLNARAFLVLQAQGSKVCSLKHAFSHYIASKMPEIKSKTPFKPVLPIYGQKPNISKPKHRLTPL